MISSFASLSISDPPLQSKQSQSNNFDPFGPVGSAAPAWKRFPDRYSPSSSSSTWSSSSQSLSPGKTPSFAPDSTFSAGSYFDYGNESSSTNSVWNPDALVEPVPLRLISTPTEPVTPSPPYSAAKCEHIPPPPALQHRYYSYSSEHSTQSSCLECQLGNQRVAQHVSARAPPPLATHRSFPQPYPCHSSCSDHNNNNNNISPVQSGVSPDMVFAHLKDLPIANRNLQRSSISPIPTPLQLANYHSVNILNNNNNNNTTSSCERHSKESSPSSLSKAPINSNLYKTEICTSFLVEGHCPYGDKCKFAHGQSELRQAARHPKWRTRVCSTFVSKGRCPYGFRCCFMHVLPSDPTYQYLTK